MFGFSILMIFLITSLFVYGKLGAWGDASRIYGKNYWFQLPTGCVHEIPIYSFNMVLIEEGAGVSKTGVVKVIDGKDHLYLLEYTLVQPLFSSLCIPKSEIKVRSHERWDGKYWALSMVDVPEIYIPQKWIRAIKGLTD
ncbi:hypothetical protein ACFOEK_18885 [Litoribrevibacter euphylliae]|uniref:ASCH domain-containing protein n=1 Tax=Litoribrevibacter euphylliae TaxID=1834034 RepID=A0ABV7HK56_9GAMM